jgi:hypothetical protein
MKSNDLTCPGAILLIGLVFAGFLCQPGFGRSTEQAKLIASFGADADRFGTCTAVDGNHAVVGAPYDDDKGNNGGAAYILELVAGEWRTIQKLTASDGKAGDVFGSSVAIDGNCAIVGAHWHDANGTNSGSAYVFQCSGSTWSQTQKLVPLDGAAHDYFGFSVAIGGDYAVIGAKGDDANGFDSGSAYVFRYSEGLWSQDQKVTVSDNASGDYFGASVGVDGNYAVVGAYGDDDNGGSSGSAYIFECAGGNWTEVQKVTASDGAGGDAFGYSVCIDGDWIAAGAYLADANQTDSGSAYVFRGAGGTWSQVQKLTPPDAKAQGFLGCAVSISGDHIVIGSYGDDEHGAESGAAYVFRRSGDTWHYQDKLVPADYAPSDSFGSCVSVSGRIIVVGTPFDDMRGNDSGSAYFFEESGAAWNRAGRAGPLCGKTWDIFGSSVAIDGDYAIVGAPEDDEKGYNAGSAYIFRRLTSRTWLSVAKLTASDGVAYDGFGTSVGISGVYAIVGAEGADAKGRSSGAAYVFQRSGDIWSQTQKLTAADGDEGDHFGISVTISQDYAIVGAYDDEPNGSRSGSAYVYEHTGASWSQVQKLAASDSAADDHFDVSVAVDCNYAIIGAYGDDDNGDGSGSAYMFERFAGSWSEIQKVTATDGASLDYFGWSVSISGAYAVVAAPYHDVNQNDCGSAYIFEKSGSAWSQIQELTASDACAVDYFGWAVSIRGNYAIVGAYGDDDLGDYSGSAYVFGRSGGAWSQQAKLAASDGAERDYFGSSVALSDTYAVVGAHQDDDLGENSGSAYVFSIPWTGDRFNFNDGTSQGWTVGGAYDEQGFGPLPSNFVGGWSDLTNHPNVPGSDPNGDMRGAVQMWTAADHGVVNTWADWWIMEFHSPDLTMSESWQFAAGYSARIVDAISEGNTTLYCEPAVRLYDLDRAQEVEFFGEEERVLNWNEWNQQTLMWSDISDFPSNYVIREVYVSVRGALADGALLAGGVYLDGVQPIGLSLQYPNGGELIIQGDTCQITWYSHSIDDVKVEYSIDNGSAWVEVDPCNTGNTGQYDWLVPDVDSNLCLVRISDANDPNVSDTSNGVFAIKPPIELLSPNGGERLISGTTYQIVWETFKEEYQTLDVKVEYSTDSGLNWTEVDPPNTGNNDVYDWVVPDAISEQCLVRVSVLDVPSASDTSDEAFRIRRFGLFVDADANGLNDGTSWDNAFNSLQDALAEVASGEDIWAAEGVYKPDQGVVVSPNDRTASFQLRSGVAIFGGYAGFGEPDPDARDVVRYTAVLSGDLKGDDDSGGDDSENSYHVVTGNCTEPNAILDGFTITGGNADGLDTNSLGGGIYTDGGSPTFTNCTVTGNTAIYGGGMWNGNGSSPEVTYCIFTDNWAGAGGGMANENADPVVGFCDFIQNYAIVTEWTTGVGGGMYDTNSGITVTNCVFNGNQADDSAGGMYHCSSGNLTLVSSIFSGNSSSDEAGGLYNGESNSVIINCSFSRNVAAYGGGIYNWGGANLGVRNCILWGNDAPYGPQIAVDNNSTASINYCDLQGDIAAIAQDGTGSVTAGAGNKDQDPLFADADGPDDIPGTTDDDLRLSPGSPCVDTGDDANVPVYLTTDLDGRSRFADGNCTGTVVIDMGAYEFDYAHWGDLDGDCDIDLTDYALYALAWLTQPGDAWWNPQCDISIPVDRLIDAADLAIVAKHWLAGNYSGFYDFNLDTDPDWTTQGQWAFGQPTGGGGEYGNADPLSGYTGASVYGVNLDGDYGTELGGPYYLTTGPLDCRDYHKVRLKFARWLNTDEPRYVISRLEVSNDGAAWTTIWEHTASSDIADDNWQIMEHDIGGLADRQPAVYIRWSYAIIKARAYPYSGWNIDDIQLWGISNR